MKQLLKSWRRRSVLRRRSTETWKLSARAASNASRRIVIPARPAWRPICKTGLRIDLSRRVRQASGGACRWVRRNRKLAVSLGGLLVLGLGSVFWQIRSQKMESAFTESLLASHTVVILPLFDLDTVSEDSMATRWVASSLSKQFGKPWQRTRSNQ